VVLLDVRLTSSFSSPEMNRDQRIAWRTNKLI
jgi:hypothetical protein